MPIVAVDAINFHTRLGLALGLPEYDLERLEEKIENICFDFGLEYDGRDIDSATNRVKLRFDVAASRYDLLCLDGLVDALSTFLQPDKHFFPEYKYSIPSPQVTIEVDESVVGVRPYIVGAIFRDVTFDEASFASFIELQDKLHQNLCRRRTLVAIGTHNLDVVDLEKALTYKALPKKGGFHFVPLNRTECCDAEGMFEMFESTHIKPYLSILEDFELIPVIQDGKGNVLSVPPIINSEFSKMSKKTKHVLVEITATDLRKAEIVLDVIICFMSQKLKRPYTVEPVKIKYTKAHSGAPRRHAQGSAETSFVHEMITPTLTIESVNVQVEYVKNLIGLPQLTADLIVDQLKKMSLRGRKVDEKSVEVDCPISRRDILHPCDVAEDVAIAIGFNNIARSPFPAATLQNINNLSERVRRQVAQAGWNECLTFGLVSHTDCFENLRRLEIDVNDIEGIARSAREIYSARSRACRVSEPKTREFEIIRPTLIPGLLNTLASNQHAQLPIRIFEIGDCVICDNEADNRVQHRRHVAALIADNTKSGLEDIHGLLDFVLSNVMHQSSKLSEVADEIFLSGRGVEVKVEDKTIGILGVIHPEILIKYGIPFPCSIFEISLDVFISTLHHTELSAP